MKEEKKLKRKKVSRKVVGSGPKSNKTRNYIVLAGDESDSIKIGDDVYVVTDEKLLQPGVLEEKSDEANLCSACKKGGNRKNLLLECGKCMAAFHLHCLSECLREVPEVSFLLAIHTVSPLFVKL